MTAAVDHHVEAEAEWLALVEARVRLGEMTLKEALTVLPDVALRDLVMIRPGNPEEAGSWIAEVCGLPIAVGHAEAPGITYFLPVYGPYGSAGRFPTGFTVPSAQFWNHVGNLVAELRRG